MARRIKALRPIRDGGYNIQRGQTAEVSPGYAAEWISRGWAEPCKAKTARKVAAKAETDP